ncbi:hypothetical protein ES702_00359 [subsurface metagenome]
MSLLKPFKEGKKIIMERCYIDREKQILGLCDSSVIFNVVLPVGWTIKRYHGNFFLSDQELLKAMLERPYVVELVIDEDRVFD